MATTSAGSPSAAWMASKVLFSQFSPKGAGWLELGAGFVDDQIDGRGGFPRDDDGLKTGRFWCANRPPNVESKKRPFRGDLVAT